MSGKLIGISGKAGSGKDTLFKLIDFVATPDILFENKKFAYKVKLIASVLTGIPLKKFDDQKFKKERLGYEWSQVKHYMTQGCKHGYLDVMTVRELLQKIGTEAIRDNVHPNAWINALFTDYSDICNWIITDVRFPNEADAIKERDGFLVRIERPELKRYDHLSETALDDYDGFDHTIINDASIVDLYDQCSPIFDYIGIENYNEKTTKHQ